MQGIDYRDIKSLEDALDWAIHEASSQHFGQVDKGEQPYILHPLRVMMAMKTTTEKIVAVLHDAMEDGYLTKERLKEYTNREIVDAVVALTRRKGETYRDFIIRIRYNDLARRVKIADLTDNMDRSRIPNPTDVDEARWKKYAKGLLILMRDTL